MPATPLVQPPQTTAPLPPTPPQVPQATQTMAATGVQTTAAPGAATPGTQTPLMYRAGIPAAQVSVPKVSTELNALTAANSPYIDQARQRAVRAAASRGLQNSTIAAAAGEEAAIAQALPIAQQDAGYVQELDRLGYTMAGNMQGRYGEHVQSIQSTAAAQIASIAAAPGMDNATKQALIQGVSKQRDADLAFAGALYEQLPAWDPGWTLLGGAGRAPTAGDGTGTGAGTGSGGTGSVALPPGGGTGTGTDTSGVGTGGAAGIGSLVGAGGGLINNYLNSNKAPQAPTSGDGGGGGGGLPSLPPGSSMAAKALLGGGTTATGAGTVAGNLAGYAGMAGPAGGTAGTAAAAGQSVGAAGSTTGMAAGGGASSAAGFAAAAAPAAIAAILIGGFMSSRARKAAEREAFAPVWQQIQQSAPQTAQLPREIYIPQEQRTTRTVTGRPFTDPNTGQQFLMHGDVNHAGTARSMWVVRLSDGTQGIWGINGGFQPMDEMVANAQAQSAPQPSRVTSAWEGA